MKITRMKMKNSDDTFRLNEFNKKLEIELAKEGYITEVDLKRGKIGMHMRSFIINVKKLGYNAKISYMCKNPKKGYKRTDVPTWEQREEFNHIINKFFDKHNITAKIVSGKYLIRDHVNGAVKEWQCINYMGLPAEPNTTTNGYGTVFDRLMTEKEALEEVA